MKIENLKCKIENVWSTSPQLLLRTIIIFHFTFLILNSSCIHRELEYESVRLEVVFDWVNEPDANPGSMSLYLFPDEGGIPYRYDFGGRNGGTIRVKPGVYHAVCINNDERDILFRGEESHSTFETYMGEAMTMSIGSSYSVRSLELPRAAGLENQPMVQQPPLLWSDSQTGFSYGLPSSKTKGNDKRLIMQPRRIVDTYIVTVRNINNVRYLQSMSGTISDMADGYFTGAMTHNDNSTTLPFDLWHDRETATAEGRFYTFGHCATASKSHKMMLYAILNDGSKYYFEFDVTTQAHNEPDGNNVYHIIIDSLNISQPMGEGGMSPSVSIWQSEDINLEM